MDKVNEVQAHSKPVERMRLTHDNQHLFSAGVDGLICMFEVKDRDIRMRQTQEMKKLEFSEEIITSQLTML